MMQFQLLNMFGKGENGGGNGNSSFYMILLTFILSFIAGFIEEIKKYLPKVIEYIKDLASKKVQSKLDEQLGNITTISLLDENTSILLNKKHSVNKVYLTRIYNHENLSIFNDMNEKVDSILDYISNLGNIPILSFITNASFLISFTEKYIQMTSNLFIKIDCISRKEHEIEYIKFVICSNVLDSNEIKNEINKIHKEYIINMENSIGDNICYFDQKNITKTTTMSVPGRELEIKQMMINSAPKHLTFILKEFKSNKEFSSLYGQETRNIFNQIKFFTENEAWYKKKGLPYQLGLMFYGVPGCGKTASIKAIANYTRRHIINVNFKNIHTATQFRNLFFSKEMNILKDEYSTDTKKIYIPHSKRIYVLEEIDAISDIVKKRTGDGKNAETVDDELTLGEILTVIDGTLEVPGRIMIITSNHPEYIDDALLRPGRIDLMIKFNKCNKDGIKEMYESFFEQPMHSELYENLDDLEYLLTPAEIQQVFLKYFHESSNEKFNQYILDEMTRLSRNKQSKEQDNNKETMTDNILCDYDKTPHESKSRQSKEVIIDKTKSSPITSTQIDVNEKSSLEIPYIKTPTFKPASLTNHNVGKFKLNVETHY